MYLEHKFISQDGNSLSYWQDKDSDKPLLLLVHGALANAQVWQPWLEYLTVHYSPIAITLSHFIPSSNQGEFGLQSHANQLHDLLNELNCQQPVEAIAWSYGADVALLAALDKPGAFKQLYLYEPGYFGCLPKEQFSLALSDATQMFGPVFPLLEEVDMLHAIEALIDASGGSLGYFSRQTKAVQEAQLQQAASLLEQLKQTQQPDMSTKRLAQCPVPIALVQGEKTTGLFQKVGRYMASSLANGQLLIVESANHMLPIESPKTAAKHALAYLLKS
ncbi:alpha/beta hydrolase [Pseudomonas sp. F1_0610]|uniref:alpha/beta fold hydrolase n=1 Tax=Pseudomonas sp. F1_0610 TaxID=3114284 RepID=UPI0039C231E5